MLLALLHDANLVDSHRDARNPRVAQRAKSYRSLFVQKRAAPLAFIAEADAERWKLFTGYF